MLNELHIENIAVIEKADVSFNPGFNVLTGETGAGKSIVIDSIGAVLGARIGRGLVRTGAERGTVTAVFDLSGAEQWLSENEIDAEDELIIQRRIMPDGRTSCRVCGTPVSVAQLRELGALLVDIHGQNDGRQLMDETRHMEYLDRFGCVTAEYSAYKAEYDIYCKIKKEIASLQMDEVEKQRLSESLRYQIEELERAQLKAGEEEQLTARRDILRNSEKLTEALDTAYAALYGSDNNAISLAQDAAYYTQRAAGIAQELEPAVKSINDAVFALTDAAELLRDFQASLDFSPEEYDRLETRLSLLAKLRRKYSLDEAGLIARLDECRRKLDDIEYADDRLVKLQTELAAAERRCGKTAEALTRARREAADRLQIRIVSELRDLSMPSVRFAVEMLPKESFDASGADEIRFVMSANAGEELGRISKIASGGELSRIMLAMKNVFAENDPVNTMIFDEIDTGVSGVAAQRVGEKLYCVSRGKQVLCVTHLPQIAAMADSHYNIQKRERAGRTFTSVDELDIEGRKGELARLHGGDNVTLTTLASAAEQLEAAERYKEEKQYGSRE